MKFAVLSILCILLFPLLVSASHIPSQTAYQRVYDWAGILENSISLEADIADFERNTTVQIFVVTIETLPPDHTLETFALGILEEWGVGQKEEDNGVVVLIVENGQPGGKLRIETGLGIEG